MNGPPVNWSIKWLVKKTRRSWRNASIRGKVVSFLILAAISWQCSYYVYRILFGVLNFLVYFIRAAIGDDMLEGPCYGVKQEPSPFWDLSQSDWFRLQRCLGNEAGFGQQGMLLSSLGNLITHFMTLFDDNPVMLIVVLFICYFVWPWLKRKSHYITSRILAAPNHTSVLFVWVLATIVLFLAYAIGGWWATTIFVASIALLVSVIFWHDRNQAQHLVATIQGARANIVVTNIMEIVDLIVKNVSMAIPGPAYALRAHSDRCTHGNSCQCFVAMNRTRNLDACPHVDPCRCFDELQISFDANDSLVEERDKLSNEIRILKDGTQMQALRNQLATTTAQLQQCQQAAIDNQTRTYNSLGLGVGSADDRQLRSALARAQSENTGLEALVERRGKELKDANTRIDALQAQINYSQSLGEDAAIVKANLENARATIRAMDRELKDGNLKNMQLSQKLAIERENHSERCQSNAACQVQIRQLADDCRKMMEGHLEYERLVRDAAIEFGLSPEEAQHINLRSYLNQVTQELARLTALGVPGATTEDLQIRLVKKTAEGDAIYIRRLETEVKNLGGNVLSVRMGLSSTPPDASATRIITCQQNHDRIFEIYKRLREFVVGFTATLEAENLDVAFGGLYKLPPWLPEPVRQEFDTAIQERLPDQSSLYGDLVEPSKEEDDELTEKLLVGECQKWYSRGAALLSHAHKIPGRTSNLDEAFLLGEHLLKEVLREVLFENYKVIRSGSEKKPDVKFTRKFEIYKGMKDSIQMLSDCTSVHDKLPPWPVPLPYSNTAWSTVDDLISNLTIYEIRTLKTRIVQLVNLVEKLRLPGSKAGPLPQNFIQGDPDYHNRFNKLATARGYTQLTLDHWEAYKARPKLLYDNENNPVRDQNGNHITESTMPVPMLPLNKEMYLKTVGMWAGQEKEPENAWPQDLVWTPEINPLLGPIFRFDRVQPDPNGYYQPGYQQQQNDNSSNSNTNGNSKSSQTKNLEPLRITYEQHRQRKLQLENWVTEKGVKGNMQFTSIRQLKKNVNQTHIQEQINLMKRLHNSLSSKLSGRGYQIPQWPKDGGEMRP